MFNFEDINISAEKINEWFNIDLDNEILTESAASNAVNNCLTKLGLSKAAPQINNAINQAARNTVKSIKTNGISKETKKTISSEIGHVMDVVSDSINTFGDDINVALNIKDESIMAGVPKSIILTLICLILNTFSLIVLTLILGAVPGTLVTACAIGPITEEFAKHTAIKGGYAKAFTIVFNAYEFSSYVTNLTNFGVKLSKAIILRLFTVGLHISTTVTQWILNNPKVQQKMGLSDSKEDKEKAGFIGYLVGVLMHALWNTSTVIGPLANAINKFAFS